MSSTDAPTSISIPSLITICTPLLLHELRRIVRMHIFMDKCAHRAQRALASHMQMTFPYGLTMTHMDHNASDGDSRDAWRCAFNTEIMCACGEWISTIGCTGLISRPQEPISLHVVAETRANHLHPEKVRIPDEEAKRGGTRTSPSTGLISLSYPTRYDKLISPQAAFPAHCQYHCQYRQFP